MVLAALLFVLDQISKIWVQRTLPMGASVPLVAPFFYLTYVENPGAAFSVLSGHTWVSVLTTIGLCLLVLVKRNTIADRPQCFRWGISLVLAGATGNLVDRVRQGRVIDFLDVGFWPVFNIADSCIVVGVALILWSMIRDPDTPHHVDSP